MGLFSSKKKHFVDTQVTRVIEDAVIPDGVQRSLINSLFTNTTLPDQIREQALNGGHRRFQRMFKFAERGDYFYGLPNAKVLSSSDGLGKARDVLEQEINETILTVDYLYFRPINNFHVGWKVLFEDYGYDPDTNTLSAAPVMTEETVYLDKMVAIHTTEVGLEPQISGLGSWDLNSQAGETPERKAANEFVQYQTVTEETEIVAGATEAIEIHLIWVEDDVIVKDFFTVELTAYDPGNEYYQARYEYLGPSNEILRGYWIYDPLTGGDQILNGYYDQDYTDPGTYFPFTVFRSEGVNRATDADINTEQYQSSEKLLHYLDMDYREIADALADSDGIEDVDQAVMMMAVPITSDNEFDVEYLFRYFKDLEDRLPAKARQKPDYTKFMRVDAPYETSLAPEENFALDIADADFRMTISFDSIRREVLPGVIGAIGDYTNTLIDVGTQNPITTEIPEGAALRTGRRFEKQLTAGLIERITVVDPQARYHIAPGLGAEGGADDDRLMLPLDYNICRQMGILKREKLYFRSLHFVFNSHVVQKIKWYERGFFKALLIAVAIIITILSYGVDGGITLGAAIAAGTATAAMLISAILNFVVTSLVFELVFTAIVEVIGLEAAQWLAIAAALMGGFKMLQHGKMTVNAANYMKASSGLVKGAGNVLKDAFTDLLDEYAEFELLKDVRQDELDEANSLLGNGTYLDPYLLIAEEPLLIVGEPPSSYFERTIHRGNIGVETMNLVQNFVSTSLRLPTMHETTGDSLYGTV